MGKRGGVSSRRFLPVDLGGVLDIVPLPVLLLGVKAVFCGNVADDGENRALGGGTRQIGVWDELCVCCP